jgi:hypothetical protein
LAWAPLMSAGFLTTPRRPSHMPLPGVAPNAAGVRSDRS